MRDTTPAADECGSPPFAGCPPAPERLRQAFALSESVRNVALARLRTLHPGCSDLELVEILVGRQLVPPSSRPARG